MTITRSNALSQGKFGRFSKKVSTVISYFMVPAGTSFDTPEGLKAEDEPCRIAFDTQGGVYPIRESVFQASYVRLGDA